MGPTLQFIIVFRKCDGLADNHVVAGDPGPGGDDPVVVQLVVDGVSHTLTRIPGGFFKEFFLVIAFEFGVLVGPHENGPEEASVDGGRVENNGVLLVVPGVGGDGDDGVDTRGKLRKPQIVHAVKKNWHLETECIYFLSTIM